MRKKNLGISIFFKYTVLVLAALAVIIPVLVVFFAAFKISDEYNKTGPLTIPSNWLNFENFKTAIIRGQMYIGLINTVIVVAVSVFGAVILGTMVAYTLNRFEFKGRKVVLHAFLLAVLIPSVTTQVATFKVIQFLQIYNTRMAGIILFMGTDIIAITIFLQFMNSISVSLDESAMLDGASYFTIYAKIILPLTKPAIATVCIIKGVAIYNDFYIPFLYMPKKELQVISTSLYKFIGPYGAHWEIICAAIAVAIVPTLIVFLSLQRFFYNGFTAGAVKQ